MPNSLLRRKESTTFALWIMFLLGRHAILGQEPPIYLRSTTATRLASPANVHAAIVDPVPPPRITRSNSSSCVSMRIFLSERQVHSACASCSGAITPGGEDSVTWHNASGEVRSISRAYSECTWARPSIAANCGSFCRAERHTTLL